MPIPVVKLSFAGDPPAFCCPVCGHKVFTEDADGSLCEHIIFVGETFSGEWQWNNPACEEAFSRAANRLFAELQSKGEFDHCEDYSLDDYLSEEGVEQVAAIAANALELDSAYLLDISTYGIACGPTGGGIYVIVDHRS